MKITKNFFLLCENTVLGQNNKLTIVNLYDALFAESVPIMPQNFTLVANLNLQEVKKTDKLINLGISIISPSGEDILKRKFRQKREIDPTKKNQKVGIVINLLGIPFPEYGSYLIKLLANRKEVSSLVFSVNKPPKSNAAN